MKKEKNTKIWNEYYSEYEKGSKIPGIKYPNEHVVRLIMQAKKNNPDRKIKVLEIGFGVVTNMIMMYNESIDVTGLEVSADAISRGKEALSEMGLNDIELHKFAGDTFPFEDESFDVVLGMECIYYNLNQHQLVEECKRVLKSNGIVFFSYFSKNHGYMDHIKRINNNVVQFVDTHPHERLVDLELYLYNNEEEFQNTFGKYFNIKVGLYETDQLPIYQSWYYVFGQLKNSNKKIDYNIDKRTEVSIEFNNKDIDLEESLLNNISLWRNYHKSLPSTDLFNNQKYPHEETIRHLATYKRRALGDYFEKRKNNEDEIDRVESLKLLEINSLNPVHLIAGKGFGYDPYSIHYSDEAIKENEQGLEYFNIDKNRVSKWDGKTIPFEEGVFDSIFSHKIAYYTPDQDVFINEVERVLNNNGEVFFWYLSPNHGYMRYAKQLKENLYQFTQEHPTDFLRGAIVYVTSKDNLINLWSNKFDIEVKEYSFTNYRLYQEFFMLQGTKRKNND